MEKEKDEDLCGDEIDFYEDGVLYVCTREKDHPKGRHGHWGKNAILTWSQ